MATFGSDLERALTALLNEGTYKRGRLGYRIRGTYQVAVAENLAKFYVRLETGEVVRAIHKSRVAPQPDLDVIVHVPEIGAPEIVDVDWTRVLARFPTYAGAVGIGLHTHQRFSGMEFPIDPRLLLPLRLSWTGTTVSLGEGWYMVGDTAFWWPGTDTLDLVSHMPTGLNRRWVLVCIDTTADPPELTSFGLSTTTGSLDQEDLADAINALDPGWIPVAAVRFYAGATTFNEPDVESIPTFYRAKAAFAPIEVSDQDLSDPPTDVDFDNAFGEDLPDGFAGIVDDAGTGDIFWLAARKSSTWVMTQLVEAISAPTITTPAADDSYTADLEFEWEFS